ncbi:MAG: DedA family protein [Thermanaeromonas sp.]|uniref:DedA family protein n=1 Tax=Thermanaeromonas sp. TaxID=2003697 RepID=UPI00243E90A5|nr:DedA family protein [Thermanaeromonas sp.]MCG0278976.1 DedA family protein [Thermanaeromonas sp.]
MTAAHIYGLLFILLLVEGIGIPGIPFEPVFWAAGYLIEHGQMSFWGAVLVGTAGNLLGNLLGYWLGARPARGLLDKLTRSCIGPEAMERVSFWFRRYGPAVVVVSRWFGLIRTPAIVCAAPLGMDALSYTLYSAIGAFTWTLAWQYASWRGAHYFLKWWYSYRELGDWKGKVFLGSLVLVVLGAVIYLYRRKKK